MFNILVTFKPSWFFARGGLTLEVSGFRGARSLGSLQRHEALYKADYPGVQSLSRVCTALQSRAWCADWQTSVGCDQSPYVACRWCVAEALIFTCTCDCVENTKNIACEYLNLLRH